MPKLKRYHLYSREEVHSIFDREGNPFYPGTGTWGLHGIIRIPNSDDFVFFVTYGRNISGHQFEEKITEDGILHWQSQPRQKLDDELIQKFINHDHLIDNIYLFLRPKRDGKYYYLGR